MQSISPETIFRGNDAWERALPQIANLVKKEFGARYGNQIKDMGIGSAKQI